MEASSIHGRPAMSLEEEEEMRKMALFREELIAKKIMRKQRAAEAAGRKYTWSGSGSTGYDWLLKTPSELEHCFMKIPGEGSHCVASDPTPTKATTARKEAIGVEGRYSTLPQMEVSSIHDQPAMSPEEEEEMRSMALYREELIERKIMPKQRAATAAGREFVRGDYKTAGYDWLLIPPSKLDHYFMKIPGEGSHCVASDPTPTKVTTARNESIGVEGKDCNLFND